MIVHGLATTAASGTLAFPLGMVERGATGRGTCLNARGQRGVLEEVSMSCGPGRALNRRSLRVVGGTTLELACARGASDLADKREDSDEWKGEHGAVTGQ